MHEESKLSIQPRPVADEGDNRFLSEDDCRKLQERLIRMGTGGGGTQVTIESAWQGNIRWARNMVISGGDTQENTITIGRRFFGMESTVQTNAIDDESLTAVVKDVEAASLFRPENAERYPERPIPMLPHLKPTLWFDNTYNLGADARGKVAAELIHAAQEAGFLAAGYVQVSASARAIRNTETLARYYPYTSAQYSVTVRDRKGTGSGWAGVDFNDWMRIDTKKLSAIALDKCIRSMNPVAIEPGRITAILEPQAVCDLMQNMMGDPMNRWKAEQGYTAFSADKGNSKLGQRVVDPRITISADPMDPYCGFVPFDLRGEPYQPVKWIEEGVLKELSYERAYAVAELGTTVGLPDSTAFHMSGGTTTVDEMIASTKRGVIVTRFHNVMVLHAPSLLCTGNTRDGFWLIENGKISKAIKNFRFAESPLFMLNNLEQLGVPERCFRPRAPAVCPPIKVRDFNFTSLMDSV